MSDGVETLYYLNRYTDEVMPCAANLEAWAEWLSKPDPDWNRPAAAEDGETFEASVAQVEEVACTRTHDGWRIPAAFAAIGKEAEPWKNGKTFYLRHGSGGGWWPDNSGGSAAEALAYADDGPAGAVVYLALMTWTGQVELRYDAAPDGPVLRVLSQVGSA